MIQDDPAALPVPGGPARIAFDRVSFRYPTPAEVSQASLESIAALDKMPEKIVLNDITFVAEPGSVAINSIDVRKAKLDSLHERIGTVMQDAHLFHDTIRANLLYAKPHAAEEKLTDALRAAQM